MRHRKNFNHLGRKTAHRKAMLANMATSLILHKRIKTTVAKAKALKNYVEPLITKSKNDTTHSRRVVFSYVKDKYAVTELFREISLKVGDRPGGYTRIIKLGTRLGDNAELCFIELVDYNENLLTKAAPKTKKRSRRGNAKKTTNTAITTETPKVNEEKAQKETAKATETVVTEETKVEVKSDAKEKKEKKAESKTETKSETKNKEDNNNQAEETKA